MKVQCLLERVLEAWAGKLTQRASALQRNSLRERERERERESERESEREREREREGERKTRGPKL